LIKLLEKYDAKLETANEMLLFKEIEFQKDEDHSKDLQKLQEMIAFYCDKL